MVHMLLSKILTEQNNTAHAFLQHTEGFPILHPWSVMASYRGASSQQFHILCWHSHTVLTKIDPHHQTSAQCVVAYSVDGCRGATRQRHSNEWHLNQRSLQFNLSRVKIPPSCFVVHPETCNPLTNGTPSFDPYSPDSRRRASACSRCVVNRS